MKKIILSTLLVTAIALQAQELPAPSPGATFSQRVGLTDITIDYSRPGMKGRTIFGDLVPYDKLWRTGANMNTTVEVSTDVNINGKVLPAGKYSMFTIPNKDSWEIIFNSKNDHGGTSGYSAERDVLRTVVKTDMTEKTESFTITINNIGAESANLVLQWEQTRVSIPLTVEVKEAAAKNIEKALAEAEDDKKWRVYRNAANYYLNGGNNVEMAMKYIEQSIEAKDDQWFSHWLKARILAESDMYKEAIKTAENARKVGEEQAEAKESEFRYGDMIDEGINEWKEAKKVKS